MSEVTPADAEISFGSVLLSSCLGGAETEAENWQRKGCPRRCEPVTRHTRTHMCYSIKKRIFWFPCCSPDVANLCKETEGTVYREIWWENSRTESLTLCLTQHRCLQRGGGRGAARVPQTRELPQNLGPAAPASKEESPRPCLAFMCGCGSWDWLPAHLYAMAH